MTTITQETCRFCSEVIDSNKGMMGRFSTHILTRHQDEPEVKEYLDLVDKKEKLWDSFMVDRRVYEKDRRGEEAQEGEIIRTRGGSYRRNAQGCGRSLTGAWVTVFPPPPCPAHAKR